MYTNSLSHHGILGMKWGIRRYQNPDGSLTEAGKKRYLKPNGYLKDNTPKELDRYAFYRNDKEANPNKWGRLSEEQKKKYNYDARLDIEDQLSELAVQFEANKKEWKKYAEAYAAEYYDRKVKEGDYDDDPELKELFIEEYASDGPSGIDAAANVWGYYTEHNPKAKALCDKGEAWIQNVLDKESSSGLRYDTLIEQIYDDIEKRWVESAKHSAIKAGIDFLESPLDSLSHHGILGMKWGIRRYQNPDGTWTEAGKKRYGQALAKKVSKASDWKKASELVKNSKVVAEFNSNSEPYEKLQRINKDISSLQKDINRSVNDALEKKYGFFNDLIIQEDDKKMLAYLSEGAEKFNTLWEKSGGKDLLMSQLDISKEYEKECQAFIRAVSGEIGNLPTKIPSALTYDIASDKARKLTANEVITLEMLRAAGGRI